MGEIFDHRAFFSCTMDVLNGEGMLSAVVLCLLFVLFVLSCVLCCFVLFLSLLCFVCSLTRAEIPIGDF